MSWTLLSLPVVRARDRLDLESLPSFKFKYMLHVESVWNQMDADFNRCSMTVSAFQFGW